MFDALWNGPHQTTIKVAMFHDSPQHLVPSGLKSWISPLVSVRTDSQSPSVEASSNAMLTCPLTPSDVVKDGDLAQVGVDVKRRKLSKMRWLSLFDRQIFALRHKSKGLPLSKDDEFYGPEPLHPHPEQQSPINDPSGISPSLDDSHTSSSQLEQDSPSSSPSPDSECSSSPSLVPTIIASRPPSPQYHSCIAEAKAFGIKVRDFAHEDHGVTLAPSIPDIGQLKASYNLYRKAGLTPPSETIRKLQTYDPDWLMDAQRRYKIHSIQSKPTCGITMLSWMQETEKWSGFKGGESPDMDNAVHSDNIGSARMETASL